MIAYFCIQRGSDGRMIDDDDDENVNYINFKED